MMKPLGDINTSKLNTGVGLFKQGETKAFILQANEFDSNFLYFHLYCCRCLHLNKNFIFLGPGFPPSLACMEVREPLISRATPARTWELGFPLQLSTEAGIKLLPALPPSENREGFALANSCKGKKSSVSMFLLPCALHLHTSPWLWQLLGRSHHTLQKHHNPPENPGGT